MAVESDAERLVGHMLGLDPDIRQFEAQPFTVDLVDRKILRTHDARKEARARHRGRPGPIFYTPDFAALTAFRRQLVIEVKLDSHAGDDEYDVKLGLAREVLLSYGYELSKAVLPGNAMHPLHSNVVLLRQAAGRSVAVLQEGWLERIDNLANEGACTVGDFCAGLAISPNLVPALLVAGALSTDLFSHPIRASTPATPAWGGLDHLQLLSRISS